MQGLGSRDTQEADLAGRDAPTLGGGGWGDEAENMGGCRAGLKAAHVALSARATRRSPNPSASPPQCRARPESRAYGT